MRAYDSTSTGRQRGVAGVTIVVLILLVVSTMLAAVFVLSSRTVNNAVDDDQRLQVLYLAETGMERASFRYMAAGVACGGLAETNTAFLSGANFAISAGSTTNFDGVSVLPAGQCRIRSTGTAANGSVRAIEAILKVRPVSSSSSGLQDSTTGNFTVDSGTELLLVATAWRSAQPLSSSITAATYNGVALTPVSASSNYPSTPACLSGTCDPLRTSSQIFYMINPPPGSFPLNFTFNNAPDVFVKVGFNLNGVDVSNPIDQYASAAGLSPASGTDFGATVVTTKANDFIIDVLAREKTGNTTASLSCNPRTVLYDNNATNKIGALTQCGPIAAIGGVTMNWTWNQPNKPWSDSIVAIKSASGGMIGWREVGVFPP